MPARGGPARRSDDVLGGAKSFQALLLPPAIQAALRAAGFRRPSPVQEAALPLARMGTDLLVQAKAGTGKTLVFAVAAVERVDLANPAPQVGDGWYWACRLVAAAHEAACANSPACTAGAARWWRQRAAHLILDRTSLALTTTRRCWC